MQTINPSLYKRKNVMEKTRGFKKEHFLN